MKCIKAIKPTKNTEVGTMTRINDVDAELKVKTGFWSYIPKTEYKIRKTTQPKIEVTEIGQDMGGSYEIKKRKK